jgi:hypothetical protein
LEAVPHCRHSGNGGPVAPGRIPLVLEADLQSADTSWEKTDAEGGSGVDLPDGC